MEPLNAQERKKALINFLIFFSITVALVVAAVLFSVEVPFKQNEQLREQVADAEREREFSERFFLNMNATNSLLDSLDTKDVKTDLIDGKIKEKLSDMDAMIEKDTISNKDFYQNIVAKLSDLHSAKKQLRDATSEDASMGELKQQLADLKAELKDSQNSEAVLRTQLQMISQRQ